MSEDTQEVKIDNPKAVLDALERAKADAKKYREQLEEREAHVASLSKKVEALEGENGVEAWKKRVIELSLSNQLAKAGITNPRIKKFIKTEALGLDDEGNLTGFDESLETVKKDLPELFDDRKRVGGTADLFANEEAKTQMTTTDQQLARLKSRQSL